MSASAFPSRATPSAAGSNACTCSARLACEETEETGRDGKERTVWRYRLADGFDRETLRSVTDPQVGPEM